MLLLLLPLRAESPDFVRVSPDGQALETAITHYVTPSGVKVDLVAVIHLGEPAYYKALDQELTGYDAVLFEAILDEGGAIENRRKMNEAIGIKDYEPHYALRTNPKDPLTAMQLKLCHILGLAFQPDSMSYEAPNFVHADLTAREFEKASKKNKESSAQLFMRLLKGSLAQEPEAGELNPLVFLTRDPTPRERQKLRRVMARHIGEMEGMAVELQGTTLVSGRNQRCLVVLGQQVKKGRKHLAILYGAAHMPDFDRRLTSSLKCRRLGQKWLQAWNLE